MVQDIVDKRYVMPLGTRRDIFRIQQLLEQAHRMRGNMMGLGNIV